MVNQLIQEVDENAASGYTMEISTTPIEEPVGHVSKAHFDNRDFTLVGVQTGFNPRKIGRLWNALSKLALHCKLPHSTSDRLPHYGSKPEIEEKVRECLEEIKRINSGSIAGIFIPEITSFECDCGATNRRNTTLLRNGLEFSCINPECGNVFKYDEGREEFLVQTFTICCENCANEIKIPYKLIRNLARDRMLTFNCPVCKNELHARWEPRQYFRKS